MAKLLTETPMSVKLKRRTAEKLEELRAKSGIRRSELIRLAVDSFLENNPTAEAVIRAAIKGRAVT